MTNNLIEDTAPRAIHMPNARTMHLICQEVVRARTKFLENIHMLAAPTEEVGELAQAMLQAWHDGDPSQIKKEAIQVACVAVRMFEEGDASFDVSPD